MTNIIIFGTGSTSRMVLQGLKDDVNILYFCDNDKRKWNTKYSNKMIISPEKIVETDFDYIVIASQFNDEIYDQLIKLGVCKDKIFEFFKYVDRCYNYVKEQLKYVENNLDSIEGFVTGISYAEKAIKEKYSIKNIFNIAKHSQDIYYDFHLIKYIIENYKKEMNKLRYVLICLNYYSFEYDMSKSSMKGKVILYGIDSAKKILNLYPNGIVKIDFNWFNQNNYSHDYYVNEEQGKRQALLDGNKNYPETVKENKKIFKNYLQLLKENNIKPIVIVCPASKYYSKYFPKRLKDEFYSIINETRKQYDFQFLDYFDSELFEDNDFYDVSHLNDKGAEKFTELLNKEVQW
mgnify:CR=1 FL=1